MNSTNEPSIEPATTEKRSLPNHEWSHPTPLAPMLAPDVPYPVDALPSIIQKAVMIYQQYGQQPLPLIACSALGNVSLACQSLANVARDNYLISPISLYFLLASGSGTRKSASDNVFSKATRAWEANTQQKLEPEISSAINQHHAWRMERDGLLAKIKRAAVNEEDASDSKDSLELLMCDEPEIPLRPTLYFEDATHEALAMHLAEGWPSASLWSDEAGIILGSHSMQNNPTRFVALLNRLWDGKSFTAHRKTTQSFTLQHRRLTLNLMMQPLLFQQMTKQSLGINRQSGFLARCLIAHPANAMGSRYYQEPPASLDCLNDYEQRITACLQQSEHLTLTGCVKLPLLKMSAQAKRKWVLFFNAIESGLKPQGQWIDVMDFASKAGENTARLAALFHLFEGRSGDIAVEQMEQAIELMNWHMQETRRVMPADESTDNFTDAIKLMNWLIDKKFKTTTARAILQLSPIRSKEERDNALAVLIEHQFIRITNQNKQSIIDINPHVYSLDWKNR